VIRAGTRFGAAACQHQVPHPVYWHTPPGLGAGRQPNEWSILTEHQLAVSVDLADW